MTDSGGDRTRADEAPLCWAEAKWWGYELHFNHAGVGVFVELQGFVSDALGDLFPKEIAAMIEVTAKLREAWMKVVDSGDGCKLVSPWVAPLMLIPKDERQRNDMNLYWSVYTEADGWSDRAQIGEDIDSDSTPAAAVFQDKLYLMYGVRQFINLGWMVYDPASGWSAEHGLSQTSRHPPSLVAHDNTLYCFAKAEDSNEIYYITLHADGQSWSPARLTGKQSPAGPAVVSFAGRMFMAFSSNERTRYVVVSESTDAGENWTITFRDWETYNPPALAVMGDTLHMLYVGSGKENPVYHSWRTADSDWTYRVYTGIDSVAVPALAVYDGKLHMTHRGDSDKDQRLFHCQYDSATQTWGGSKQAADNESYSGPALVNYCDPNAATATDPQAVTEQLYTVFRGTYDKVIG